MQRHFSQYGNILLHNDDDLDLNEFVVKLYAYIEDKSIACALNATIYLSLKDSYAT